MNRKNVVRALRPVTPAPDTPRAPPEALAAEAVATVTDFHDEPAETGPGVDAETRREMVATAAYYIAEQRGFLPGHELADWVSAERAIAATLAHG
jgi:hypothetical protein